MSLKDKRVYDQVAKFLRQMERAGAHTAIVLEYQGEAVYAGNPTEGPTLMAALHMQDLVKQQRERETNKHFN